MLYKEINMSYLLECHPRVDFQVGVQFLLEDSIFRFFFFFFSCGGITIEESIREVIHPSMNVHRLVSPYKNGEMENRLIRLITWTQNLRQDLEYDHLH